MKRLAIIGAFVFLLGLIIFASTLAVCGWDITKISTTPIYQEKQFSIENSNQTITLHDENMPLLVGKSNDHLIHLIYFVNENEYYEVDKTGTADLKIEKKTQYQWYDRFFNINFQKPSFSILLPSEYSGSLFLETNNGRVCVSDVSLRKLELKTNNALVNLTNLSSVEDIEAKTSNARIEIQDLVAGGDITLSTNNGKIVGNIIGEMDDFSIASETSGKNSLPERTFGGSKHLKATTSNGEISIQFTD